MANILFSRAGGLLSLEGRSLLFSSVEASIAYAKGKDVEMARRVPVSAAGSVLSDLPFSKTRADGSVIRPSQSRLLGDTEQTACICRSLGQKMEAGDYNEAQLADKHV